MGPGRTRVTAVGAAAMLRGLPASASAEPPEMFLRNGDEFSGWLWLRDADGCHDATWSFWGGDAWQPVTVTFGLLAVDGTNGGPGVDTRAWVTIGSVESGAAGPAIEGPRLLTVPERVGGRRPRGLHHAGHRGPPGCGHQPHDGWPVSALERRGPTGDVLPEHITVNRDAVTVNGLVAPPGDGPCLPAPEPTPSTRGTIAACPGPSYMQIG